MGRMAKQYGMGNLPMDLYKMAIHDNWDYDGRADGQGDYTPWGIYRIGLIYTTNTSDGRDIFKPDAFLDAVMGSKDHGMQVYSCTDDTLQYTDGGFYWHISGYCEPCDIKNDHGADDWYWYD